MPSQPFDYPTEGADPTFYKVAETTSDASFVWAAIPITDSKIATGKTTFTAGKVGAITFWSEEVAEDSVIPIEPQFRDQYGTAVAHNIDYVLLHGDETTVGTGNVSYYGATPGGTESFLIVDGLRNEPLRTTTADGRAGGTLTLEDVNATRKLMGTAGLYGANVADLVMFCDTATGLTFEDLDEVRTIDKFGANATVMRGQLGAIKGIPIIKSQDYGLSYTSGLIHSTPGTNASGQFIIVNRTGVKVGWRRRPRIYVGQVPYADSWYILALFRFDIGFFGAGMVGMTYGLTL